jgi:hypothetical protein
MTDKKVITYFVSYGVNYSHRFDGASFDKLKDAKEFIFKIRNDKVYELSRREEFYRKLERGDYEFHPFETIDIPLENNFNERWKYGERKQSSGKVLSMWTLINRTHKDYYKSISITDYEKLGKAKARVKFLKNNKM